MPTMEYSDGFPRLLLIVGNILSYIAVIIIHAIAGSGKLHHASSEALFDSYLTKFTPAEWTFSIWILILLLLGVFVIYQALPASRDSYLIFEGIGIWFMLTCLFLFIWPFCFHWQSFWAAAIFLTFSLICLIVIYVRVSIGYSETARNRTDPEGIPLTPGEFWLVQVPFSVSLAWIVVITIVNWALAISTKTITVGWTPEGWSALVQTLLTLVTLTVLHHRHDPFFAAVMVWTFLGIANKHHMDAVVNTAALVNAAITFVSLLLAVGCLLFHYFNRNRYHAIPQ